MLKLAGGQPHVKLDVRVAEAIDCAIEAGACWKRARLARNPDAWVNIAIAENQDATELLDAYVDALDPETIRAVLGGA